jgi:hypothetical protein
MVNTDKGIVAANQDSVAASLDHLSQALDARVELGPGMVLARGAGSWPVVAVSYFLIHTDDAVDCSKAQALAEWLYCTSSPSSSLSTLASPTTDALTTDREPEFDRCVRHCHTVLQTLVICCFVTRQLT